MCRQAPPASGSPSGLPRDYSESAIGTTGAQTIQCGALDHLLRATARAEAQHFWFRGFRYFVAPLVRQATAGVRDPRILDCGCGTGNNLDLLRNYGDAYGFDLTAIGLQIGREAGRQRLVRASVAAVPFRSSGFDVATSFDVLYSLDTDVEHAAVAEMHRVLRPGGHLIVNVAALEALRGDHSVLSREVRRYDRRSLSLLLTAHGFQVLRMTYTNAVLFPPMLATRALQRWRGLRAEESADQEMRVPAAPVNLLMTGALRVESWWLRVVNNPFGSSLLCLARKPG
jgi:SAM-dependent methyltransferase